MDYDPQTAARRFSSRKFIVTGVAGLAAIAALFAGKIDGGNFTAIVTVCVGAYNIGNALAAGR